MYHIHALFDLDHTLAKAYLAGFDYPHEALSGIGEMVCALGSTLGDDYTEAGTNIWIHRTATVAPTAAITGPCIIGENTEIRHCAYIRGSVLIGKNCVVGNSAELKNAILFDGVQTPHYNYVGDSILGRNAHMGAGAVTSNVRGDKGNVIIHTDPEIPTNRKKVGAFLGDFAEIGCNAVLNPGTVIGRNSRVYPTSCVRGCLPENCIWRSDGTIIPIK